MRNQIICVVIVAVLAGTLGFTGGWYKFVKAPVLKAQKEVKVQQEEMQKMTRHGEILEVATGSIIVDIEKSGNYEKGKQKYHTNEYTSIQIGMQFVNQPGETADLTQYFQKGDYVDLLVKDGQALLIHRDARKGDQIASKDLAPEVEEEPTQPPTQ